MAPNEIPLMDQICSKRIRLPQKLIVFNKKQEIELIYRNQIKKIRMAHNHSTKKLFKFNQIFLPTSTLQLTVEQRNNLNLDQ